MLLLLAGAGRVGPVGVVAVDPAVAVVVVVVAVMWLLWLLLLCGCHRSRRCGHPGHPVIASYLLCSASFRHPSRTAVFRSFRFLSVRPVVAGWVAVVALPNGPPLIFLALHSMADCECYFEIEVDKIHLSHNTILDHVGHVETAVRLLLGDCTVKDLLPLCIVQHGAKFYSVLNSAQSLYMLQRPFRGSIS